MSDDVADLGPADYTISFADLEPRGSACDYCSEAMSAEMFYRHQCGHRAHIGHGTARCPVRTCGLANLP